ncbi:glucocorticoid receptor-like (DNA-binding domain) [Marasmius fiardii PR-910]|nr:glucocorticoid receptor-like (DNA-binding domain) [Marasmius fiardii PR-910]
MPAHSNVLPDPYYPHGDRIPQSHAHARGTISEHWSSGDLDSYNSSYASYPMKAPFQTHRHPHLDSSDFVAWSHTGDQANSQSMLEESYARGYSPSYTGDHYSRRCSRGDAYGYLPDQGLLYTNQLDHSLIPKTSTSTWAHSPGPIVSPPRSQSTPSSNSRWVPTNRPSEVPSDATQWSDLVLSPRDQYESKPVTHNNALDGYSPLSSSISSPSPSPSPVQLPSASISGHMERRNSEGKPSTKICSHCRATSTPLWRREPGTQKPLCNACGLYLQQRNKLRPQELIDADVDDNMSDDASAGDGVGPECSHCHTRNTSVWRRSKTGEQLCNACGVYSRLRGKDRPLSLKRNKIKPRTKHGPKQP